MPNSPDIELALRQIRSRNKMQADAGRQYLICKYQPLIHKLANQICPTCDIRDMIQAGNLGIMVALKSYNGSTLFGTWVFTQIRDQLQKQRELAFPVKISRFLLKKGAKASFEQITEETYADDVTKNLVSEENAEKVQELMRKINLTYSSKFCKVFSEYYFLDTKLVDLSKKYRVNAKSIIQQMINKLRMESQSL